MTFLGLAFAGWLATRAVPLSPEQANVLTLIVAAYFAMGVLLFGANVVLLAVTAENNDHWQLGRHGWATRRFAGFHVLTLSAMWLSIVALYRVWA